MCKSRNHADSHAGEAAKRFDSWADSYGEDRISGWFRNYQARALQKFNFSGSERFLDIGCGPGWAVREAGRQLPHGQAYGIDISPAMIEKAEELNLGQENCSYHLGNAEAIPFDDSFFNAVLCTFSFHHYKHPDVALSEFSRVLEDDGILVIIDAARDQSSIIWLQDRFRRYFERSHVCYYTAHELLDLVRTSGLTTVEPPETESGFMKYGKLFTGLVILVCRPGK